MTIIKRPILPDGVACGHAGCLHHVSHPCEGCGRIGGRRPVRRVFIDNFSGSVGELKPRQKGNARLVLEVLARDPDLTTWDMDDSKRYPLWKTIQDLLERGFVIAVYRAYPWLRYEVTEAGKKFLAAEHD